MERKLFQQLLDLKQMQIRIGRANEQVLAKRLIDGLRKDAITVDLRPYDGSYSFHQLEVYLYSWVKSIFVKKYQIKKNNICNDWETQISWDLCKMDESCPWSILIRTTKA